MATIPPQLDVVPDEPHVNWLALSDDEAMDLMLHLQDNPDFKGVSERLMAILAYWPPLHLVN